MVKCMYRIRREKSDVYPLCLRYEERLCVRSLQDRKQESVKSMAHGYFDESTHKETKKNH